MSSITIKSNIASLNAERRLGQSSANVRESFTRLSSGLRINKASDDAAGLAIAEALKVDKRVYGQGIRNLNDGISLLSIADSALNELSNVTIRLGELAEQSASGSLSNTQREALDAEAQALKEEYFRIAKTTEFNGVKLFDGAFGSLRLQAGFGVNGGIESGLGGAVGTAEFGNELGIAGEDFRSEDIAIGDLNGDGNADIVSAGFSGTGPFQGYVTVILGNGDGSFQAATSYTSESQASYDVDLGDLNGDGFLDIVTGGRSAVPNGFATVRLGRGDGTFGAATSYTTQGGTTYGIALGDFNNDDILDMASAGIGGDRLAIRLGAGDGTFGDQAAIGASSNSSFGLDFGDINNDGNLDLIRPLSTPTVNIEISFGRGDGTFDSPLILIGEVQDQREAVLADINNDGNLDVLGLGLNFDFSAVAFRAYLGHGDGTFESTTVSSFSLGTTDFDKIVTADLNGDGILDLSISGSSTIASYVGNGDGTFKAVNTISVSGTSEAHTFGDLDNDGVLDLAVAADGGNNAVHFGETTEGVSPLLQFSLATQADARQALPLFKTKLNQLASQRGKIGAFGARLSKAISTAEVGRENFASAASQITDADVAVEAATLLKNKILQEAGVSILAQANQSPALALFLLNSR